MESFSNPVLGYIALGVPPLSWDFCLVNRERLAEGPHLNVSEHKLPSD